MIARRRLLGLGALGLAGAAAAAVAVGWPAARASMDRLVWLEEPEPAPDTTFLDATSAPTTIAAYAGRVVLLNFWATWCPPCREEMPSLDRLQAARGGGDFTVLAVSLDRGGWNDVLPFVKEHGLAHLPLALDPGGKMANAYGVFGLPTSIFVDAQGRVVAGLQGSAAWDSPEVVAVIDRLAPPAADTALPAEGGATEISASAASCECGGPKAHNVRLYGTVAPPDP